MDYTLPRSLPDKKDFFIRLLDAVFPELKEPGKTGHANDYKKACRKVIKELELADRYSTSDDFTDFINYTAGNGDFFSVLYEMNEYDKRLFSHDNFKKKEKDKNEVSFESRMVDYNNAIFNLISSSAKTMDSLLDGKSAKLYRYFETASFFSWLLLKRKECVRTSGDFLRYCMDTLGLKDYTEEINFTGDVTFTNNSFSKERTVIYNVEFSRITDTSSKLLILSVFLICALIGRYPDKGKVQIQEFYKIAAEELSGDSDLLDYFNCSQERLLEKIKTFEPRSVSRPGYFFLKDFFVFPRFEKDGKVSDPPLLKPGSLKTGTRLVLTGRTGYGKSMYLSKLTQSILENEKDVIVINVTAKDFCDCYQNRHYRDWTKDLAVLFFMKNASEAGTEDAKSASVEFDERHRDYLTHLAKEGRLVMILDSFDEIPPGDVRDAYLDAVRHFCTDYCAFIEKDSIGAHVLLASREMQRDTMESLDRALLYEDEKDKEHYVRLKGLDDDGKKELVRNWQRYGDDENLTDEIYDLIESNHYFRDAAESPYILTLMCAWFGNSYGSMTDKYMAWLERKLKIRFSDIEDTSVRNVLSDNMDLIKRLALETIKEGSREFDGHLLQRVIEIYMEDRLPDAEYVKKTGRIRETLVMQSGLITMAEADGDRYIFTDENLRFALASKKIMEIIFSDGGYERFKNEILDRLSVYNAVNVMVRVICDLGFGYVPLTCRLTCDMLTIMTETPDEERLLIRGLTDLLLNRYKTNLISAAAPGNREKEKIEPVQRLVVLRIHGSPEYKPDKNEKSAFEASEVYRKIRSSFKG